MENNVNMMSRGDPLSSADVNMELNNFKKKVMNTDNVSIDGLVSVGIIEINTLDQKYTIEVNRKDKQLIGLGRGCKRSNKMVICVFDNENMLIQRLVFNIHSVSSINCSYSYEPVDNDTENDYG